MVHTLSGDKYFKNVLNGTTVNTKLFILDYLAAAAAGYQINKTFNRAVEEFYFSTDAKGRSRVLFNNKKLPTADAAFLNACYAHGADMDDGNRKAMGHVGANVISAVMAVAESLKSKETDIITAINVGYEVYCRVAATAQPDLVHRGFHSTGTAGVVASAAAVAKLMGFDQQGIYNSMAISVTQASGLMIIAESGQSIKPLNPANAARCGILSAYLTAKGVKGGELPLDSKKGWFHAMSNNQDYSMLTDDLGKAFCIDQCYIKPYPSCRHTHCALQCAKEMISEGLKSDEIESVEVYIYKNAIDIAGQIVYPEFDDEAKFSIHYSLAAMLSLGRFGFNELKVNEVDKKVQEMTRKITLIPDSSMEDRDKGIRGCKLVVNTKNQSMEKTVLIPKGDPENAFTLEDMKSKLLLCTSGILTSKKVDTLIEKALKFGQDKPYKGELII